MANTKNGGGNQQEAYDPKTGKYIKEDSGTKFSDYHAGSGMRREEIISNIQNGTYGAEFAEAFNEADEETKKDMIEYVNSFYDEQKTQQDSSERYTPMTKQEYFDFFNEQMATCGITDEERRIIRNQYIGTGEISFYTNTAIRYGYQYMVEQFKRKEGMDPVAYDRRLTEQRINEYARTVDRVTHLMHAPRDMRVDRYLGTAALVSWCKGTNILDGFPIENNGRHDRLDQENVNLSELANRLKENLVGSIMPVDGTYLSFSAVPKQTHMGHKKGDKKKILLLKIDVQKGDDFCLIDNHVESEGLFPKETQFYVKDVKLETGEDGEERVVLYYGIVR